MANNKWIIEDAVKQSPTFGKEAARVGTGIGLSALKGLEGLASFLPSLLLPAESETLKHKRPSELIGQGLGYSQEELEPRNLPERLAQRTAEFGVPALLTGGTSGLKTSAIGSTAASLLGEAGIPEPLQDVAQLGTEIIYGRRTGKLPTLEKLQKQEYDLAQAAVKPSTKSSANVIEKAISNVEKNLATEVSKEQANKIRHTLETIQNNIGKGNISPTNALALRKKIYQLGKELPAETAREYLNPLTKGINDYFAVYAAENPTFYKHLKAADKLTELKNMNSIFNRYLEGVIKFTPFFKKIPFLTDLIDFTIGTPERFLKGIMKNSEARKYYFNTISSITKNDPNLFIKNLNKLHNEIEPEMKGQWIIEKDIVI